MTDGYMVCKKLEKVVERDKGKTRERERERERGDGVKKAKG